MNNIFLAGIILFSISAIPYLIYLIGITFGKKQQIYPPSVVDQPSISVVISAYNEEKNIGKRLKNLRGCCYPNMEIMFVDDCSTDRTFDCAKHYLDLYGFNYHLTQNHTRLGVSKSYNLAIRNSKHEIVIVTDADTTFELAAIHWMIARLTSNPYIGAVTGNLQPIKSSDETTKLESHYRNIYGKMCEWESAHDSTFNFNGALVAFRKQAVEKIEDRKGVDDANIAFAAIRNGYRAVYEKNAIVYETIPHSLNIQIKQKIRRASGLINAIIANRDLLWVGRSFSKFFFLRFWMYLISPVCFFIGAVCNPILFASVVVSMLIPFCRAFALNQSYLMVGLLSIGRNVQAWESTTSLEVREEV